MMHRLALALCAAARHLLPPPRKLWADAMLAELSQAETDRAALAFAAGCVVAAGRARYCDRDSRLGAGLWSIAIVTALFAVLRFECAGRGVAVLLGGHDGMRDALAEHGASLALLARYDSARPSVVAGFALLGCAQLAGAWFLSRRQLERFLAAGAVALVIASLVVAIQLSIVWSLDGVPSEFHALLVQALALPALLAWFHRRPDRLEEP